MDVSQTLVPLLMTYQLPAIFVGAFFFGETVIISAAYLSAQGIWTVQNVFWLAFAGTIASDSLWYLFGRKGLKLMHRWERTEKANRAIAAKIDKLTRGNPFIALLFIKFLYGTRILTILYLASNKIPFLTFFVFNAVGTLLWLVVVIGIGWLAGQSIFNIIPFMSKFEYALTAIIVLILLFKGVTSWLNNKILNS